MNNNFQQSVYDTWNKISPDGFWCTDIETGQNNADCLHHIMGRGRKGQTFHQSIYNSCPLNNERHINNHSYYKNNRELLKTVRYIIECATEDGLYKNTKKDNEFLEHYKKIYK